MKTSDRIYFFGPRGKQLLIQEWGRLDQPVILLIHGFPGCAEHGGLLAGTSLRDSFRLIAMDRPGYGKSDLQKDLTPMKFAQQILEFLDHSGIQKISILSVSGGAPYSMAVAFLLKDRVTKISSVAGVAPLTRKNFKFMNPQQKKAWALRNFVPEKLLEFGLNRVWQSGLDRMDELLFTEQQDLTGPDQAVFQHPEVGPRLAETLRLALEQGPGGLLLDMKTYSNSWGFDLKAVKCPVSLWHGGADDVVHHRFALDMQSHLPQAQLMFRPEEGHYSLPMNCRDEILGDLLELA